MMKSPTFTMRMKRLLLAGVCILVPACASFHDSSSDGDESPGPPGTAESGSSPTVAPANSDPDSAMDTVNPPASVNSSPTDSSNPPNP